MMLWVIAASVPAFLVTYILTPPLISKLKTLDITGTDVHKAARPVCAEMGGLSVLLGVSSAFCLILFLPGLPSLRMLGAFSTILLAGVVGVVDDVFILRQRYKVILVAITAIPLLLVESSIADIWFPFVGTISFGLALPLLIPLSVATSSNLTNMFAGFNGLESGIGAISMVTLGILSITQGQWDASMLAFPIFAAFIAFLRYNWYPAKVFPGDTGTLLSGAAIASISILANVEAAGIILLAPSGIDFTLKMLSRSPFAHRRIYGDTQVTSNGQLVPPRYPALCHAFMTLTPLNEKDLVTVLLFMEAIYATIAVLLYTFY
jgi:UDP-N-acetylglucosamine--dolichyl-phosphate N-acetylglucosaminephosphotransferase